MQSPPRKLDAMIFDLDGTLVDSRVGVIDAVATGIREVTMRHLGQAVEIDPQILRDALGKPAAEYYRTVLPAKLQHLAMEVKAVATEHEVNALANGHGTTYAGVLDTLEALRERGVALAVISNAQLPYFEAALEHLGIAPFLSHAECHEQLPADARPPYKRVMLRRALRALGVGAARACMVGDRAEDLEAGLALGCATVGIPFGFGTHAEVSIADATVDEFRQLLEFAAG